MARKRQKPPTFDASFDEMLKTANEPDRGRALILACWLDDALDHYMRIRAIDDTKVIDELFGPDRPLSTFSARINAAYGFAYISEEVYRDLNTIRGIRNTFAHERGPLSFGDQSIADRCKNLLVIQNHSFEKEGAEPISRPTASFVLAALAYIGYFIARAEELQHPQFSESREEKVLIHNVVQQMSAKYRREVKE